MQILKSRKGFTLMELIVVLIIIAILMAALLPSLIGWINDARESALRTEGRTALVAIQGVVTQARGTGKWSDTARTDYDPAVGNGGITVLLLQGDRRFNDLMMEAGIYGYRLPATEGNIFAGVVGSTAGLRNIDDILVEGGNVVGLRIANTTSASRNSDGIGPGLLLVGREPAAAGGGDGDDG